LHEAQSLAHARGVVGIQYPRKRLGFERLGHGADELAMAESLKIEVIGRCRAPKPKRIDSLPSKAHYGAIIGYAKQTGWPARDRAQGTLAHLERAVQLYFDFLLRASDFPWVLAAEPIVRLFALPAALDHLFKNAIFVPEAITHGRKLHGGH